MRIIGGTHRSRGLLAPPDAGTTRPITDRVKQSVFDRLVALELMGGNVLDIFAGTGSLGLEALSRGADHCAFVEQHRAVRELLKKNLHALGLDQQATVLGVDALGANWVALLANLPVRLMFCDPPYAVTRDPVSMARVARLLETLAGPAEPGGALVLRTDDRTPPPSAPGWEDPRTTRYGSMAVHLFQRPILTR